MRVCSTGLETSWFQDQQDLRPYRHHLRMSASLAFYNGSDQREINPRRECWFLVSTAWMDAWAAYTQRRTDDPPGPVANLGLFADLQGRQLRPDLEPKRDYRGLAPLMWFIFVELYGKDPAPALCRYAVDVYQPAVVGTHREAASTAAALKARVEVSAMRETFLPQDDDDESVVRGPARAATGRRAIKLAASERPAPLLPLPRRTTTRSAAACTGPIPSSFSSISSRAAGTSGSGDLPTGTQRVASLHCGETIPHSTHDGATSTPPSPPFYCPRPLRPPGKVIGHGL